MTCTGNLIRHVYLWRVIRHSSNTTQQQVDVRGRDDNYKQIVLKLSSPALASVHLMCSVFFLLLDSLHGMRFDCLSAAERSTLKPHGAFVFLSLELGLEYCG